MCGHRAARAIRQSLQQGVFQNRVRAEQQQIYQIITGRTATSYAVRACPEEDSFARLRAYLRLFSSLHGRQRTRPSPPLPIYSVMTGCCTQAFLFASTYQGVKKNTARIWVPGKLPRTQETNSNANRFFMEETEMPLPFLKDSASRLPEVCEKYHHSGGGPDRTYALNTSPEAVQRST